MGHDLFTYPIQQTSLDALDSIRDQLPAMEARVYHALRRKPRTCYELVNDLSMLNQTVTARMRGLAIKNMVKDSGGKRKTGTGRSAIVWRITTEEEREALQATEKKWTDEDVEDAIAEAMENIQDYDTTLRDFAKAAVAVLKEEGLDRW